MYEIEFYLLEVIPHLQPRSSLCLKFTTSRLPQAELFSPRTLLLNLFTVQPTSQRFLNLLFGIDIY